MKLTTKSIMTLTTDKADHVFWDPDLPSFGLRVRGGARHWLIQYRHGSSQHRESLGDIRKVTLEAARAVARKKFAQLELGIDPLAEKKQAKVEKAMARLTLGSVADRYLDARREVVRRSTYLAASRHLTVHWAPLRERPIGAIGRAEVAARLQELMPRHGRVGAARARATLSALYGWAQREGLAEHNPVAATNDPDEAVKARERVLADHELATIWNACADDDFGRIVRLLILTGCRRSEIGGLLWSDIDLGNGVLKLPPERVKNGRTFEITLPSPALDILRAAPRREGREHVFGTSGPGFTPWSIATAALKRRIDPPLEAWTLHDLRRSFRTGVGALGVQPHIAELLLNHVKGGVEAVYDKHKYQREMKAALAIWADHVLAVVEGRAAKGLPLVRA
jgi:integrase